VAKREARGVGDGDRVGIKKDQQEISPANALGTDNTSAIAGGTDKAQTFN
jgi:hypothetical protein